MAQRHNKIDSIYYLVDTTKTPLKDRMWEIDMEYPSFKVYTIVCSCLRYDQKPTFLYDTLKNKGTIISKSQLKALFLIKLSSLITKAQQYTSVGFKGRYAIFIVEPIGKKYIYHRVNLLTPRGPSIDYENIPPNSSTPKKH